MSAPEFTDTSGTKIAAIQFDVADPRTHWNVNFGHPTARFLDGVYWVQTVTGPQIIDNGDWVTESDINGQRAVISAGKFDDDGFVATEKVA